MTPEPDSGADPGSSWPRRLRQAGTWLLYGAMLAAVLALWNNDAPQFIYVAF